MEKKREVNGQSRWQTRRKGEKLRQGEREGHTKKLLNFNAKLRGVMLNVRITYGLVRVNNESRLRLGGPLLDLEEL